MTNMIVEDREYLFTEVENFGMQMTESNDVEGKVLYVEGIAMQADTLNGNGRIYPLNVLTEAVDKYINEYVNVSQALGECDHPPRPDVLLAEASHIIEKIWIEGNNVYARARILDTPKGRTVRALIEGGWIPRVSTRGMGKGRLIKEGHGSTARNYTEITKFKLTAGFDFVHNQSAPGAIMAGVYESNGHTYIPIEAQSQIDWGKVAGKFKRMVGVESPLIIESTNPEQTSLGLSVRGDKLIIECNQAVWAAPLAEIKKYLD